MTHDDTDNREGSQVNDLKTRIARGEYEIDSARVAQAIISKARTIKRVRSQINAPQRPARRAGRITAPKARERRIA